MFGWDDARDAHQQVYSQDDNRGGQEREGKFSHELVAGAAAFEGMKLFEDNQRKQGKVVDHQLAKELLAGCVGGELDKLFETKGMSYIDRERAQRDAKQQAEHLYDRHYVDNMNADRYDPNQYDRPQHIQNYRNNPDNY
ncbi:MAG: hypothetical protein M1826_007316 [Phylliscum demangeonii]|nr:MAG: hypothetical protein M1826_007316 [Phylliscum demangeonii]